VAPTAPADEEFAETGVSPEVLVAQALVRAEQMLGSTALRRWARKAKRLCDRDRTSVRCHEANRVFLMDYELVVRKARRLFVAVLEAASAAAGAPDRPARQREVLDALKGHFETLRTELGKARSWDAVAQLAGGPPPARDSALDAMVEETAAALEEAVASLPGDLGLLERCRTRAQLRVLQLTVAEQQIRREKTKSISAAVEEYVRQAAGGKLPLPSVLSVVSYALGRRERTPGRGRVRHAPPTVEDIYRED